MVEVDGGHDDALDHFDGPDCVMCGPIPLSIKAIDVEHPCGVPRGTLDDVWAVHYGERI